MKITAVSKKMKAVISAKGAHRKYRLAVDISCISIGIHLAIIIKSCFHVVVPVYTPYVS